MRSTAWRYDFSSIAPSFPRSAARHAATAASSRTWTGRKPLPGTSDHAGAGHALQCGEARSAEPDHALQSCVVDDAVAREMAQRGVEPVALRGVALRGEPLQQLVP